MIVRLETSWAGFCYNGQNLFKPVKNIMYNKEIKQMIFS